MIACSDFFMPWGVVKRIACVIIKIRFETAWESDSEEQRRDREVNEMLQNAVFRPKQKINA